MCLSSDLWKQKKEGPPRWEGEPTLSLWKRCDYSRTHHHPQWYYRTCTFAKKPIHLLYIPTRRNRNLFLSCLEKKNIKQSIQILTH